MRFLLLGGVLLALAGCGSSDDESGSGTLRVTTSGASTAFTADDVEDAFESDLATGGGIVDLGTDPPKSIECEKSGDSGDWSCRVTPAKGDRVMTCSIVTDPTTRTVTKRSCAPVDY